MDVDHLGTIIRTSKGRLNVPTPYGERINRNTDEHKVMDYALKGYDEDLLAVRMGQRYYDPQAKRFLTPDSYFLENYDKIVESPVEGNLYSYAKNDPISFVDPQGTVGGAPETLSSSLIEHGYGGDVKAAYNDRNANYEKAALVGASSLATVGAIVAAPAAGAFVVKQATALGVATTLNVNTAVWGAGMYAAKNPEKVANVVGAAASFVQGVVGGVTNSDAPPVDGNYSPGNPYVNAAAGVLGDKIGKSFRENYVERH